MLDTPTSVYYIKPTTHQSVSLAGNMHYCCECHMPFRGLRDLPKHERKRIRRGCYKTCNVHFPSKEKQMEHFRNAHMMTTATRTESQSNVVQQQGARDRPRPHTRVEPKRCGRHPSWRSAGASRISVA